MTCLRTTFKGGEMRIPLVILLLTTVPLIGTASFTGHGDPFSLTISTKDATVKSGAEVRIAITLTNTSNNDLAFFNTSRECDYSVWIRDADGKLVADTEHKRKLRCSGGNTLNANILVRLKAQESIKEEMVVSDLGDMTIPGTYSIQVIRKIPRISQDFIKSNIINVSVTE